MLSHLDDSPWHQLPTTFDHVGTSDVRFFDRFWFAASDRIGQNALQFTIGVYQNMNVVDGGFVVIHRGKQHNIRVSRQLRPTYDTFSGPLRYDVREAFKRIDLTISPNESGVHGELVWTSNTAPQEERHHFARRAGRVLEDYSRYDQIGALDGWLVVGGEHIEVDSWWSCRDHSWGVRERVGIPEPYTGEVPRAGGSLFAFLFFSTTSHAGHIQVTSRAETAHITSEVLDLGTGVSSVGERVAIDASFIDDARPRRFDAASLTVTDTDEQTVRYDVERVGPAVAMLGLGYGGYDDGLGLGVYRGITHIETDTWDVTHGATVVHQDGTESRPVHRIQPVRVTRIGPDGTSSGHGSLTFIGEVPLDNDGRLRLGPTRSRSH